MAESKWIAGRYEVLEASASDGREELRARDRTLAREVLLVRSSEALAPSSAPARERALREARALAALKHPGVQQLFEVFEDEGRLTLVLEPVSGETLAARLEREGRLPAAEVRRIGLELSEALAAVHQTGAVHRDVSEKSIVLRADGSACLAGFRFAKPTVLGVSTSIEYGREKSPAKAGESAEKLPDHPAPEQFGGEAANARSDLFALGCVLYRALTRQAAMPDLATSGWRAPADPGRLAPGIPRELSQAVLACLARSPIGRPQSALELRDKLRAVEIPGGSTRQRAIQSPMRRIAAATGAALLVSLGAWRFWPRPAEAVEPRGLTPATDDGAQRPSDASYETGFRKSLALLIGIGECYAKNGFQPLANAVHDVEALEDELRASASDRWEVEVLKDADATFDNIRKKIAGLTDALEVEDRALIYFAGHGVPHERSGDSGWLIPSDGETLEKDPSRLHWLPFDALDRFLKDAPAKHVLLAMDCCYGGRIATSRGANEQKYSERFLTQSARVVLASGRANEQVSDGVAQGHSPFADVLLGALRPGSSPITSSMLYSELLRTFTRQGLRQTPVLAYPTYAPPGEFVFLLE